MIYLIRHAQSLPSSDTPENRWPLSKKGMADSENLIKEFKTISIDHIFSSPYLRTIKTIKKIADDKNLDIQIFENLKERKKSESFLSKEENERVMKKYWADFDWSLPNCESSNCAKERMVNAITNIVKKSSGKNIIISSHGNVIGLFLNHIDRSFGYDQWKSMSMPTVFEIEYKEDSFLLKK